MVGSKNEENSGDKSNIQPQISSITLKEAVENTARKIITFIMAFKLMILYLTTISTQTQDADIDYACSIELALHYNQTNATYWILQSNEYSNFIREAVFLTFQNLTERSNSMYYDNIAGDEYINKTWTYAGIDHSTYETCMIFNNKITTRPTCPTIPNPILKDSQFIAVVDFCVIADQNAYDFLAYLNTLRNSVQFTRIFQKQLHHLVPTGRLPPTSRPTTRTTLRPVPTLRPTLNPLSFDMTHSPTSSPFLSNMTPYPSAEPTSGRRPTIFGGITDHKFNNMNAGCKDFLENPKQKSVNTPFMECAFYLSFHNITGHSPFYSDHDEYINKSWKYGGIRNYSYHIKLLGREASSAYGSSTIPQSRFLIIADQNQEMFRNYIQTQYHISASNDIFQSHLLQVILSITNTSCYLTMDPTAYPILDPTTDPTAYPTLDPTTDPNATTTVFVVTHPDPMKITYIWVIVAVVVLAVVLIILLIFLTKHFLKTKEKSVYIENGLGVIITIAYYDNINIGNDDIHMDVPDLDMLHHDYDNLTKLFKMLNYAFIPNEEKLHWTEKEIMHFLQHDIGNELFDNNHQLKYDGIILCVSSHGVKNNIITSDHKIIENVAIHRAISRLDSQLRDIPRICIFDSCQGCKEREISEQDTDNGIEFAKYTSVGDVNFGTGWNTDNKNPDYNLVYIQAANAGYQAKASQKIGSYLIYNFVEKVMNNIENDENKRLVDIIDEIEKKLHDTGKQKITTVFNTGELSRNIKFKINQKAIHSHKDAIETTFWSAETDRLLLDKEEIKDNVNVQKDEDNDMTKNNHVEMTKC
eukprot:281884_1